MDTSKKLRSVTFG